MTVKSIENELEKGVIEASELEKKVQAAARNLEQQKKETGERVLKGADVDQVGSALASAERKLKTLQSTYKAANERIAQKRAELRAAKVKAGKKRIVEIRKKVDELIGTLVVSYREIESVNEKLEKLIGEARVLKGEYGISPGHSMLGGATAGFIRNAPELLNEIKGVYPGVYKNAIKKAVR